MASVFEHRGPLQGPLWGGVALFMVIVRSQYVDLRSLSSAKVCENQAIVIARRVVG